MFRLANPNRFMQWSGKLVPWCAVATIILLGAGLYLAYTPFNALLFDRFIAASGRTGTAGFLIYVADAAGYVSSVALLVLRDLVGLKLSWVEFLRAISYSASLVGLVLIVAAGLYFHGRLPRRSAADDRSADEQIAQPRSA